MTGAKFGFLGEAANSVGGYIAGCVPTAGNAGLAAAQMLAQPLKTYLLLGVEAELDTYDPQQAVAAMKSAELVVAMSPYQHKATDYAHVLLPIAPFTETSGSFVNAEGRLQSFHAVVKPLGETRPAWKVLRVLANLLGLEGFGFESSQEVLAAATGARWGDPQIVDETLDRLDLDTFRRLVDQGWSEMARGEYAEARALLSQLPEDPDVRRLRAHIDLAEASEASSPDDPLARIGGDGDWGPILERLEKHYGSPMARPFYCSTDPDFYRPEEREPDWDLGYMGTYSVDRQESLERLMLEPARRWAESRMVVAGPQYPAELRWPPNVERIDHLAPDAHRRFYNRQRFVLNLTRASMIRAGYSPSVRLFEADSCGRPIISDYWEGLDSFLKIGEEILVAYSPRDVLEYLLEMPRSKSEEIGRKARARILAEHTAVRRAAEARTRR